MAVETYLRWLTVGAWGLPLALGLIFLTLGFDVSPVDLALRIVCVGLVGGLAGLLVSQEKRHARQTTEERETASQLSGVYKALSTLDLATLLQRLADEIGRLIPCRGACVILLDRDQEEVEHIVTAGRFPAPLASDLPVLLPLEVRAEVLAQGTLMLNSPHAIHTRLRSLRAQEFAQQSLLITGRRLHQYVGFLILADKRGEAGFRDRDAQVLAAVAEHIATAIENACLFADVRNTQAEQRELLHALISAQEQEHKRTAAQWHEQVGARLFDVLQGLRSCQQLIAQRVPESQERFEQLAAELDTVSAAVRGLTNELHPSVLDDFGFVAALRDYVAGLDEHEPFRVTVQAEEVDQQLPSEANLTLFRITQEALRNIRKHARARNVQIAFVQEHAGVSLLIKDDGQGFNPEHSLPGRFGLLYMRERAEACGGTFRVVSARGQGTEVRVDFPSGGRAPIRLSQRLPSG